MIREAGIVVNPDLLEEAYIPPDVPRRDSQIQELALFLSPAARRKKPVHVWLFGRQGIGKTLIAKFMLRKLERQASVSGAYVKCWGNNSYYSVLDRLVRDLRILGAEKLNSTFRLNRLAFYRGKSLLSLFWMKSTSLRRMKGVR